MRRFFTSDWHIDHRDDRPMPGYRRHFFTAAEWRKHLPAITKSMMRPGDRLYMLGDLSSYGKVGKCMKHVPRGTWFIRGNHDGSDEKCQRCFGGAFRQCMEIKLSKTHKCWLSHYCHMVWPSSHYGSMHLYGHTHDLLEGRMDTLFPNRKSMDVSPETAYRLLGEFRPFTEEEILDILGDRSGHDCVSNYRKQEAINLINLGQ